jgi:hypothetical protein
MNIISTLLIWYLVGASFFSQGDFSAGSKQYASGNYKESYDIFVALWKTPENLHNVGNCLYHLSASGSSVPVLQSALLWYEASLEKEENELTRNNYEYIKKLLQEKQNASENTSTQKQKQDTPPQQNTQTGTSDFPSENQGEKQSKEGTGESEQKDTQNNTQSGLWKRGQEYILNGQDTLDSLTPEEQEKIASYVQDMQEKASQNREYFWKQEQDSTLSDMLFGDIFGWNPFFQDSLWSWEKDW